MDVRFPVVRPSRSFLGTVCYSNEFPLGFGQLLCEGPDYSVLI